MADDERFSNEFRRPDRDNSHTPRGEIIIGPVADWATDFSPLDPAWDADFHSITDDLRERCPIAHTERFGGGWLPTRYEDVAAIAYDVENFSSRSVTADDFRPPRDLAPAGQTPPITSDPPFHHGRRKMLLPAFTRTAVARLEPSTRAFCHSLIDGFEGRDVVDATREYAQQIPSQVIGDLLGFVPEDLQQFRQQFRKLVGNLNSDAKTSPEERKKLHGELLVFLMSQINEHVEHPRDDLTTYLLNVELDGDKLDANHILSTMGLLFTAGITTVFSTIGASLWHLAGNLEDRERLVANPGLVPIAMEEFLRAYAPATTARLVKEDMYWRGVDMKADDWVLLPFPAANRDPAQFDQADKVIIDREVNRHAAFGLGIHRCLGSHLARMEVRIALEVWLERIPAFTLDDPSAVVWGGAQTRGPQALPVRIR